MFDEGRIYIPDLNSENVFRRTFDNKFIAYNNTFIKSMTFAFATMSSEIIDRKHVESTLILGLRDYYEKKAGTSLNYLSQKNKLNQIPIGNINKYPTEDFELTHLGNTNDIPEELLEITSYRK